jgi:hypothetical protein
MESFWFFSVKVAVVVVVPVLWAGLVVFAVVCAPAENAMTNGQAKTKIDLLTFIDNILKRKNRLIFNQI